MCTLRRMVATCVVAISAVRYEGVCSPRMQTATTHERAHPACDKHTKIALRMVPGTLPGRSRRGQNRPKFGLKRSWRDLGGSGAPKDAPRTLQKRLWTLSDDSPDAPGALLRGSGALLGGPWTLPRRLGERSGRVFRATLVQKLAETLAERFFSVFSPCASCRASAPMCTTHQF